MQLPSAARLQREQQAVLRPPPPARACSTQPASATIVEVGGVDAAHAVQPRQSTARPGVPLASGTEPPTSPVLPPCGDDRRAVRAAGVRRPRRPRRSSPGARRRARGRGSAAPVDLVRRAVAADEHLRRADARREGRRAGSWRGARCSAPGAGPQRARTCRQHAANRTSGERDLDQRQRRRDAALAAGPHRAFGDVEPDAEAQPAIGVEAQCAAGRAAAAAAAAPSSRACRDRSARATAPRRGRARSARASRRPPAPASGARRRSGRRACVHRCL